MFDMRRRNFIKLLGGAALIWPRAARAQQGERIRRIGVLQASPRDLMVQEVGHAKLRERGIDLIAADNPGSFIDATPTAKLVRQVLGAISEFDKAMTVAPLS
jgi:DNA invertase Pin-like site-specific DNA recombinase